MEELIAGAIAGTVKGIVDAAQAAGMSEADALARAATVLHAEAARVDARLAELHDARTSADAEIDAAAPK